MGRAAQGRVEKDEGGGNKEEGSDEVEDKSDKVDKDIEEEDEDSSEGCLLYTSPSPRDKRQSRMPSSA